MGLLSRRYWSASEAFFASRKSTPGMEKRIRRYGPPPTAQPQLPAWNPDGRALLPPGAARKTDITVDPRLRGDMLEMINAAAPALIRAYDRHLGALAFSAWRDWPVDTGYSKAGLMLDYIARRQKFIGRFSASAAYLYFIKGHPHRRLIDRPSARVAVAIGTETLDALQQGPKPR